MALIESTVGLLAVLSDALSLLDRFLSDGKALNKKIDEKDLRRFRSSCGALMIAMDSRSSDATRSSHLSHAENGFLEYVQLDPRRDFGPLPGTHVLAIANAGLARIYETRGDDLLFQKHRLLAFFYDQHIAREKLFPDFYQAALREQCQNTVNERLRQELRMLDNIDYNQKLTNYQCSSIGPIDRMSYAPREWRDKEIRRILNTTAESLKQGDIRRIEAKFEENFAEMIDNACRDVTQQMLRGLQT